MIEFFGFRISRTPPEPVKDLARQVQRDPEYAWSWHCSLAMMAVDAGSPHAEANRQAAIFMTRIFGVDTRFNPHWASLGIGDEPVD